jgi:hypothetical protein
MFRGEMEDHGPLACLTQHVNPNKIMKHPARRRLLNPFPLVVGKRRLTVSERCTAAVFHGGIHQLPLMSSPTVVAAG